jgi:insulin-like growth factor 2 mRNA-binding protein 1
MTIHLKSLVLHHKNSFIFNAYCENASFNEIFYFVHSVGGKILLSNLPLHVRFEDLEPLLTPFGSVQNCEKLNSRDGSTQTVQVSYETQEQAQQ